MKRPLCLGFLAAAALSLASFEACASGSVAPRGNADTRGAYSLGKAITFRQLVCRTCPIQRRELNRDRARLLLASLSAAFTAAKPGTPDDDNISSLCEGSAESCVVKVELVHYYLKRRFRL